MDDFDICDFFDFDDQGRRHPGLMPRKPKDDEWLTLDWQYLKIKKLETRHLVNILNFIARNNKRRRAVGGIRMLRLENEARKRGLVVGADKKWKSPHTFDVIKT